MNYKYHYFLLCDRAISRTLPVDIRIERHHIVPKCMSGDNAKDNYVKLTPEEHYLAHLLLAKMFPENKKLLFAAHRMTSGKNRNNKMYGWLRRQHAEAMSILKTGSVGPNLGKKMSDETKAKLSAAHTGRKTGKPSWNSGIACTEETKAKISASNTGRTSPNLGKTTSDETRAKQSLATKGRPKTAEHLDAVCKGTAHLKGVPRTEEAKAKMRAARQAWLALPPDKRLPGRRAHQRKRV